MRGLVGALVAALVSAASLRAQGSTSGVIVGAALDHAASRASCGLARPGRAAVVGRALDADASERPLAGAEVIATWMEFPRGASRGRSVPTRRVARAVADAEGTFHVCDVPTETFLTLQVQDDGRAGAAVRLMVPEDRGSLARDLSLSRRTSPTIAEREAAEATASRGTGATREELRGVGTAALSGLARDLSGEPVAGASVHVRDALASATTDSAGHFELRDLPAGTQILVATHAGYSPFELPVELRPGAEVEQEVLLVRPLSLEAVRMTASASDYDEFDAHRRTNPYGQYLTLEQIDAKKHAAETVDLFDDVLGFTALGRGADARVIANTALSANPGCSSALVEIEGEQGHRINDLRPAQIGAIEAYPAPAFVPARYAGRAPCGVVVIWRRRGGHPAPAAALRENGYP